MSESIASTKSYAFAVRIVKLYRILRQRGVERELLSQLLRAGTSVAANLAEAVYAHGTADYAAKIRIALKECSETHMWLRLLHDTGSMNDTEFSSIEKDCSELRKILPAILIALQKKQEK